MSADYQTMLERVDQIERAHRSAKPKDSNPSWFNTHRDLGYVLMTFRKLQHEYEELRWEMDGLRK